MESSDSDIYTHKRYADRLMESSDLNIYTHKRYRERVMGSSDSDIYTHKRYADRLMESSDSNIYTHKRCTERVMASSDSNTALAYVVVYVKDVAKSVAFYSKAFGYPVRRLDESHRWAELESGQTTIAFTPVHQHETDEVTGEVHTWQVRRERDPVEVCFAYEDVDAAYYNAVKHGAVGVREPEEKEWGQKVGYVRDIDGIVVRLGSFVSQPQKPHIS